MGLITALTATAMSAGLVITGVSTAGATGASITLPPGGVLEAKVTTFCGRVPALLERVDKAQARISGDASTKGSIAWLQARTAKAEKNGNQRVARRAERRIDRRSDRLKQLPAIKAKLTTAQQECSTLGLPAPSTSTSTSSS